MTVKIFRQGDCVRVTFSGKTVNACVVLASRNGFSLALQFDAMLGGYVGMIPVLWDEETEEFRDLITHERVEIQGAKDANTGEDLRRRVS